MAYPADHTPSVNDGVEGLLVQIADNTSTAESGDGGGGDASAANQVTEIAHLSAIEAAVEGATPSGTNNIGDVDVASVKGAANIAVSQVTATGTAETLAIARATRRSVLFTNTHATASCWIGPATVTAGNGQKLGPGQSCPFTWVGLFQIIDDGATHPVVCVADEYD